MLHGVNPDRSWNIGASKTGYFVIFASAHGIFSEDFAAVDAYDESEPILSFKHTRQ